MTWNSVMGFISTIALFLPAFFILALRLGRYRSFPILMIYYFSVFSYNLLTEKYIPASNEVIYLWGLSNNLLDAPLMLLFFSYFSTSANFTRRLKILILAFILFELTIIILLGFNTPAITIILGPGLLIVLCLCLYFFIRQAKMAIIHRKATGKALMVASLLFAYGCYTIIYLLYYVFKAHIDAGKVNEQYVADTFLVYFLVTTFSSLLMCAGIIIERKRVQKLNELKITRKELSTIYTNTKTAAPLRTAMLDFDKDQWS